MNFCSCLKVHITADVQYFYEEQLHRMECLNQEPVLFEDVLCQMHDMIQPASEGVFTLADLKKHKVLSGTMFNILFNLNKFVAFETRDPFLVKQVSFFHKVTVSSNLRHCLQPAGQHSMHCDPAFSQAGRHAMQRDQSSSCRNALLRALAASAGAGTAGLDRLGPLC